MSTAADRLSRRRFLGATMSLPVGCWATSALAKGASTVKIDRVEVFPVRYRTLGYFKFFKGRGASYGRPAVLVKLTADNGVVGWGQSVPMPTWSYETLETATIVLRDYLAPTLVGRDPSDIPGAHDAMDKVLAPGFSTGMPISRAGLDLALHDLAGKLAGKSLAALWGRPRGGPLVLSWTVNVRSLDEVDPLIDEGWRRGYRNFNIKVAPDPKFDVELARRVRQRAPKGFLWADANGGYDLPTALEIAPKLADAGVDVLESPIRPNRIRGYQALKKLRALPILMDEGVVSPVELEEFIRLGMLDGLAMKPSRCGGLLSNKRQIELILREGLMWLGSGLTDPDIGLAASLALYGAFELKKPAALNGPQFIETNVLARPLAIHDGLAEVPDGPGLEIEVDEAKVVELMKKTRAEEAASSGS